MFRPRGQSGRHRKSYRTGIRSPERAANRYADYAIPAFLILGKVKVIPQQAEVAQGVSCRLRPRISLTFGITVVSRQPYAPAVFTPGEITGTYFSGSESAPGHMVL